MTDTPLTQASAEAAGNATAPQFDRQELFQRSLKGLERLERLYDATRKRLERAKRAEDFLAYLIASKRGLIEKLLDLWFTPEDLAGVLLEEIGDIPVSRKKVIAAIQKCRAGATAGAAVDEGNSGQKRRGRPPKSATAAGTDAAPISGQNAEIPGNSAEIPENSTPASAQIPADPAGNSGASPAKNNAPDAQKPIPAPAPGPQQDSPERLQRLRKKAPPWVAEYGEHPEYGSLLLRQDGESQADYFLRMWHTEPPWAGEFPRQDSETETQWIQKCWLQTSPEERAAHLASLPSTAR